MHAVWSRRTNERLAGLGLDFLSGYVWGRAAALGEPAAGVVVSSFAVFEPGMLAAVYEQGRTSCSRSDLVVARTESTIESLNDVLGGVDITAVAERLVGAVTTVTTANVAGRPLFAGLADQPWPEDPYGRLWRACDLLREHRGDGHIAACIAAGLGPVAMNVLTELWVGMPLGSYSATARLDRRTDRGDGRGPACRRCARGRRAVSARPGVASRNRGNHRRHGAVTSSRRSATASMPSLRSSTSGPPAAPPRARFPPTHSSAPPADRTPRSHSFVHPGTDQLQVVLAGEALEHGLIEGAVGARRGDLLPVALHRRRTEHDQRPGRASDGHHAVDGAAWTDTNDPGRRSPADRRRGSGTSRRARRTTRPRRGGCAAGSGRQPCRTTRRRKVAVGITTRQLHQPNRPARGRHMVSGWRSGHQGPPCEGWV